MNQRIFFNIHAQRVPDVEYLLQAARTLQPHWALCMDGLGLCQQIKAQVPNCNVISRIYPDENWSAVNAKDWVAKKKAEIGSADVWCYTFNEVGSSPEYLQLNADIITEAAKVGLKVVVGNMSVGTPANPYDWETTAGRNLMIALNTHRDIAVLGLHEYACAVVTSGFYGGYPDNAGVQPGTAGGINLIPRSAWPLNPYPCYHLGRFKFLLDSCQRMNIPAPRIVLTEHGFDDVSDIKAWTETLDMTDPYQDIRGWESIKDQWHDWYPGWTHDQAYYEQLIYADETLYQDSPVEAQLIFCWGHTSDMWAQFDVAEARELHQLLANYEAPPDPDGGNGELPPMTKIDLLPYFNPGSSGRVYELGHSTGGTELLQTQPEGSAFRHVKQGGAAQFSKWERLCANNTFIYRDLDTSGDVEVYRLKDADLPAWSKWCPRYMAIGERYTRRPTVTWLNKQTGQPVPGKTYPETSDIVLEQVYGIYTMPNSGVVLHDVIRLAYYPAGGTVWTERYYYGKGYGLVAWESKDWYSFTSVANSPHPAPKPEQLGAWASAPPVPTDPVTPPVTNPPKPANAANPVAMTVDGSWKLRAEPDTSAAQIGLLKTGEQVTMYRVPAIDNDDNLWHFVERLHTPTGEASQGYTAAPIPAPVPPQPTEPVTFTMIATIQVAAGIDASVVQTALASITKLTFMIQAVADDSSA